MSALDGIRKYRCGQPLQDLCLLNKYSSLSENRTVLNSSGEGGQRAFNLIFADRYAGNFCCKSFLERKCEQS